MTKSELSRREEARIEAMAKAFLDCEWQLFDVSPHCPATPWMLTKRDAYRHAAIKDGDEIYFASYEDAEIAEVGMGIKAALAAAEQFDKENA